MENRGYRGYELEQDDEPRSRRWGTTAGLMTAAVALLFLHTCQNPAYAEGEVISVHFACKSKAVAVNALKSPNVTDFLAEATAKGWCELFNNKPAVLGASIGQYRSTIGGRSYLLALHEIRFDRTGKPWYAWTPVAAVEKEL